MRKIILGLALALATFAGTAHAGNLKGIVAPAPGALKNYLQNAKVKAVKTSTAHNSQYYKFTQALAKNPGQFRKINLGTAVDFNRTAYIPKVYIKGLDGNTAYIRSGMVVGPKFLGKVHLPLF